MALLITITVITLMMVTTIEVNRRVRSNVISTAGTRDRVTLSYMASSGIHAAMAMLIKDRNDSDTDSLQEDWANPEKVAEVMGDIPFESGRVSVEIIDEMGKIQVNSLVDFPEGRAFNEAQHQLWENFIAFFKLLDDEQFQDIEPSTILNSTKDWIDSGDDDAVTGLSGAESDYYQGLEPPYSCRNAPFDHLEELARVKGVTADLFDGVGGESGISSYLTVYGVSATAENKFTYKGKININTASLPVIAALLPPGDAIFAQPIDEYRLEKADETYIYNLSSPTWYKDVPGLSDVTIKADLITTSSDIFRIRSVSTLDDMSMTVTAVVQRAKQAKTGKWTCSVLCWQPE